MPNQPEQSGFEVHIEDDCARARLVIHESCDTAALTREAVHACVLDWNIVITEQVARAIDEAIASFQAQPAVIDRIIARSTPAIEGEDGRFEWEPKFDPDQVETAAAPPSASEEEAGKAKADYYKTKVHIAVCAGDLVGRFHPPTASVRGQDVLGQALEATPGDSARETLGANVTLHEDGRVVAKVDGVLLFENGELAVDDTLNISGCVDFSTGNIEFDGPLHVHEGVRDRFAIKATGDVRVDGLIEAATISVGGSFTCRQGMSGRDRGQLLVKGDALVGYLDKVRAEIGGTLSVSREINNCRLVIGGALQSESAVMIGGEVAVTGAVRLAVLGSQAGTPPTLILGTVPLLDAQLQKLAPLIAKLIKRVQQLEHLSAQRSLTAAEQEKVAAVNRELTNLTRQLEAGKKRQTELKAAAERRSTVDVLIEKHVHRGVRLQVGDEAYMITGELRGPLRILRTKDGRIRVQQGAGSARALTAFARPISKAA